MFEVNATANPKSGVALRNVTNGTTTNKGYIQIRKTITVPGQELDGYSYLIYHSGCANKTNSVSGDIWFLTDGNGYVEYGKDSNGNGTLTPGDTYCVLEQTNECLDGSGDRCAVRHTHGQVPTTTFRPVTSEYQITVGGGVNQVSFTNTDTPDIPGSLEFCLGAKKYMEADNGEWYPLVGVPFELWHFADNRIEQVDTTKYSDSTGYIRFDFSEDELINHDRTVKNFFIVEGTKGGSDNWQQYYKQDGNKTPYVYGLSSISTSGPVIGHFWNVKWPDWVESSYRDNNLGLWAEQSLIGCGETGPSGASTNESKTLINTKVYFCLRVKKAPEDSSDKIQSDEIGAMEFVAEHPGSDPISSNSENGSVKLQSDGTAIVSFFTGDSYDTGVTVDGQFYDDYASTPGSNLSGGPDKLLPDEWTVREVSPPEGYTLNEDKVLTVR